MFCGFVSWDNKMTPTNLRLDHLGLAYGHVTLQRFNREMLMSSYEDVASDPNETIKSTGYAL